jgi:diadenosine tetraphosphate (Ap4A) HIT family hydrolase
MSDTLDAWDSLAAGVGCPFDGERPESSEHWDKVASLSTSTLYLHQVQTYRGYSLLVYDGPHATRLDQLPPDAATAFMSDLLRVQRAIVEVLKPDHVNLELLGNVIPHLHWHIVPRYKTDPRWGSPIWMTDERAMPRVLLSEVARASLIGSLRSALAVHLNAYE